MKHTINVTTKKVLADLQTPVGIYLKIRDLYPESALLESSDYHGLDNSISFVAFSPLARFKVVGNGAQMSFPGGGFERRELNGVGELQSQFNQFMSSFDLRGDNPTKVNGVFGYTSYDAVRHFMPLTLPSSEGVEDKLPDFYYILYRFILVVNHHKNEMSVVENIPEGSVSELGNLESLLSNNNIASYTFSAQGIEESTMSLEEHRQRVERCVSLCHQGVVSQIVLSRGFSQQFSGDDFNVYRSLRTINPSPYLFYFDFGSFRIFGSSPETNCKVSGREAFIDPIAGTYFRTGDDVRDGELAKNLLLDEKENSEHDMLVELAQKELMSSCEDIKVVFYKSVQFYSHVIHLVSRVSGRLRSGVNSFDVYSDTFPAGTLTGSPKMKAIELIDELEGVSRGAYGGCLGYIGFDGAINQAITIRSFVSRGNKLYYQAGSGIVAQSDVDTETKEVERKLGALKVAIDFASKI